ncbi:hypothetical protein ABZ547_02150 [Streptomyces sparsogenes]
MDSATSASVTASSTWPFWSGAHYGLNAPGPRRAGRGTAGSDDSSRDAAS